MAEGAEAAIGERQRWRGGRRAGVSTLLALVWWASAGALTAEVTIRGTVTLPPARIVDYVLLPVQDEAGHGVLLEALDGRLDGYRPGQRLQATGTAGMRSGSPVVRVTKVAVTDESHMVAPRPAGTRDLCGPQIQGALVTVEGRVLEAAENVAGEAIRLRERPCLVQIFLPHSQEGSSGQLARLLPGDRIRVTGVAMVYAPTAASRWSQILITSASAVTVLERSWPVPPYILLIVLLSVIGVLGVFWMRLRRLARLRQMGRSFLEAGEAVLGAATASAIVKVLSRKLTASTAVTGVRVYLLNPATMSLESVTWESEPARQSYTVGEGTTPLAMWLGSCVRNRTLLSLPGARLESQAAMLVPLLRQAEIAGVLQLDYPADVRGFVPEEQMAAQHLGNLVSNALERMEQQAVRERLFRTEKLAAVGQLISGVATDLKQPLDAIARAAATGQDAGDGTLRTIAVDAGRAAELVARLGTIAQTEQPEAKVVDLRALLNTVCAYRFGQWETQRLQVRLRLEGSPAKILGSAPQLEIVFLNLLTRAQGAAAGSRERSLSVALTATEQRVQAEIGFAHDPRTPVERDAPESGEEGLGAGGDAGHHPKPRRGVAGGTSIRQLIALRGGTGPVPWRATGGGTGRRSTAAERSKSDAAGGRV